LSRTSSEPPKSLDVTTGAPEVQELDLGTLRVSHARFPGGQTLASHYHPRACVSVILEGGFVQRFGGRSFECEAGSVLVKPPEETHQDRWVDVPTRHLIIEPHPARHDRLGTLSVLVEGIHFQRQPGVQALALRLLREMSTHDSAQALAVEGLTLELLARIARRESEGTESSDAPQWLERVRDLLHDRFRESPSLEELGAAAGVHPTHVSRTFTRVFGVGPAAYIRRLRLAAAKRELLATEDPISRIALRNGFSDQSHFTREMKRETGVTPGQYRGMSENP